MGWQGGTVGLAMIAGAVGCRPARSTPTAVSACEKASTTPPESLVVAPTPARPVENLALSWRSEGRFVASHTQQSLVLTDGPEKPLVAVDARDGRKTAELRAVQKAAPFTFALAQLPERIGVLETFVTPCPDRSNCTATTNRLVGISPTSEEAAWSVELGIPTALRYVRAVANDRVQLFLVQEGDGARAFDADGHERWSLTGLTHLGSLSWSLASDRLLVTDQKHTTALQPERGCSFWTVDERMLGTHARHVVTARSVGPGYEVVVRAAADGAIEHRFVTPVLPERSAIVGTVLLVQSHDRSLAAYDLQTKLALWTRSSVDAWTTTVDAVFVADRVGITRALTPTSGAVVYEYSVACHSDAGVVPQLWTIASDVGDGVAVQYDRELVVLTRASAKAAPVSKTIRGVVRVNGVVAASVRLFVGEQLVRTDEQGRYSVRVTRPGRVTVEPVHGDVARLANQETGNPDCGQLYIGGPGYPAPPVAIDSAGAEQTVSFDLRASYVCIGQ